MFAVNDLSSSVLDAAKLASGVAGAVAAIVAAYTKVSPKRTFRRWLVAPAVGLIAAFAAVLYFGPRLLPRHAPAGFSVQKADGYTALYPKGWRVVEDDVLKTTYRRSRFESPDKGYWLVIDRTPGEDKDPLDKAEAGDEREIAAKRPGYKKLERLHHVQLGGAQGVAWTYKQGGNRYVDYFLRVGGDGYAVAGSGFDFETVKERARRLAASIETD